MTEEKSTEIVQTGLSDKGLFLANPLPRTVVYLDAAIVARVKAVSAIIEAHAKDDPASWTPEIHAEVVAAYREAQDLEKAISTGKKELVAPVNVLIKRLNAAVDEALNPLTSARANIGKVIVAYEAAEAERKRQAYEAEKAEYERKLAEHRAAEEAARAQAAKAEAERTAAAAAAGEVDPYFSELFDGEKPANDNVVPVVDLASVLPPPPAKPVEQTVAKTVALKQVAKVRILAPEWLVRRVTDKDGNEFQLMKVDEAEVLRALKAGCQVSGKPSIKAAELYYEEGVAAVGRRK